MELYWFTIIMYQPSTVEIPLAVFFSVKCAHVAYMLYVNTMSNLDCIQSTKRAQTSA